MTFINLLTNKRTADIDIITATGRVHSNHANFKVV